MQQRSATKTQCSQINKYIFKKKERKQKQGKEDKAQIKGGNPNSSKEMTLLVIIGIVLLNGVPESFSTENIKFINLQNI